jgi:hypothetical protein
MNRIVTLNLSSNKIKSIESYFCNSLPNLQSMDLRANQIKFIAKEIGIMI